MSALDRTAPWTHDATACVARGAPAARETDLAAIVAFYTATDADYGAWSRDFNMHFGFRERGMNPLDREAMLERMNDKVAQRLALDAGTAARIADLGCGTGAVARALALRHPRSRISAVTIVPAQVARGACLNARCAAGRSIDFVLRDFTDTGLPAGSYDGAYAVESACHAAGAGKARVIAEAHRLLKPGARMVIADFFLKTPKPLPRLLRWAYERWCTSWAVPELPQLDAVRETLKCAGFDGIEATDISWNVAPSVAHVPWIAGRFLVAELVKGRGRLSLWRRRHVVASVLSIVLGLHRAQFGYYLVSARKSR